MEYISNPKRYDMMTYRKCGKSGLKLPTISLGLWHNFGYIDRLETAKKMIFRAFDLGITHFDLANNYGPPPGSAESNIGKLLKEHFGSYRDELIISTKAGYWMWPGPYGEWSSRKNLLASLDQSLRRMGLEYVDIFYSHRYDPDTPLKEAMGALDTAVRSGKALYVGISSYPPDKTQEAIMILEEMGTPLLIYQPKYSMFSRSIEGGLIDVLRDEGLGCIVFSPLAQGLLSDKYLEGIPENSRIAKETGFLQKSDVTQEKLNQIRQLNVMAKERGQSLVQMALAWVLRDPVVTSALVGASSVEQIEENVNTLANLEFSDQELQKIDNILKS